MEQINNIYETLYERVLTECELDIINKNRQHFYELQRGTVKPENQNEKHFVKVFRDNAIPETTNELIWLKYQLLYEVSGEVAYLIGKIEDLEFELSSYEEDIERYKSKIDSARQDNKRLRIKIEELRELQSGLKEDLYSFLTKSKKAYF